MQDFSKERVRRFRNKAEELRAAAGRLSDEQCRSMILQIAQDYENLADAAETRSHASSTVCSIGTEDTALGVNGSRSRREAS